MKQWKKKKQGRINLSSSIRWQKGRRERRTLTEMRLSLVRTQMNIPSSLMLTKEKEEGKTRAQNQ